MICYGKAMHDMQKIASVSLILLFLFIGFVPMAVADLSEAKIETIYTKPYHDRYQHSFKIFADDEPVGPYAILVESDIDSKHVDDKSIVKPNTWVQWFIYIEADDPKTIKVTLLPA